MGWGASLTAVREFVFSWERFINCGGLLVEEREQSQKRSSAEGISLLDDCVGFNALLYRDVSGAS